MSYAPYMSKFRVAYCWAHARRDAIKAFKKTVLAKQRVKKTIAFQLLERIRTFYRLEDEWKGLRACLTTF